MACLNVHHKGLGRPGCRVLLVGILGAAGLVVGVGGLVGCTSMMGGVDKRVDKMLAGRTLRIGAEVSAELSRENPDKTDRDGMHRTELETVNPGASGLGYELAAADRDVAARLESYTEIGEDARLIDLSGAWRIAQESSREYRNSEEDYILSAIRLLIEQHRWGPRFFDDVTADVDGSLDSDSETSLRVMNELRATQRLPYGGDVEARLVWQATEQLRDAATDDYVQSTDLVLSGSVPLLRGAGQVAREDLIQSERDLVYAARDFERFRREFLVSIARDYFGLVGQLDAIANQERSLVSREDSLKRSQARVEAGQEPASSARRFEGDVLSTRGSLIGAQERFRTSLDRFKIRLGLPVGTPVLIDAGAAIPLAEPASTPAEAARLALSYRLDLQNNRDRIDDARRAVANSRNNLLPDLNLNASVNLRTGSNDRVGGFEFDFDDTGYSAGVTFGLPLDREIERLNVRSAVIGLERRLRDYEQFRDNVILDARAQRRLIDQQRYSLTLAEREVETSELRLEELELREAAANLISDAQDDLLRAENSRDDALRSLRTAMLDYLLASGLMRVKADGSFEPLPGMRGAVGDGDTGPGTPE